MEKKLGRDKIIFKLLGSLPSKFKDSRKCMQLNLIDVTLSPDSI